MIRRLILAVASIGLASAAPAQVVSGLNWPTQSIADIIQYAAPSSGQTVSIAPGISAIVLNNGSLLATLTVQLPAQPVDGQRVIITSGAGITILTIDTQGIAIKGLITSLALNGYARYIYSASANAWFRTG